MTTATARLHAACTAQATFDSPIGPMLLARTALGLAGAWFDGQKHHPGELALPHRPDDDLLRHAAHELDAYFSSRGTRFEVPLDLQGTPFQRAVWQALLQIASGTTCSYSELARTVGVPAAVRAVGGAVGRNPVSVIVPCHRIIGSSGLLTGYAGGIDRKRALLAIEQTTQLF